MGKPSQVVGMATTLAQPGVPAQMTLATPQRLRKIRPP